MISDDSYYLVRKLEDDGFWYLEELTETGMERWTKSESEAKRFSCAAAEAFAEEFDCGVIRRQDAAPLH